MIIWLVFMLFYCFGRRPPTSDMGAVAALGGIMELVIIDLIALLWIIG